MSGWVPPGSFAPPMPSVPEVPVQPALPRPDGEESLTDRGTVNQDEEDLPHFGGDEIGEPCAMIGGRRLPPGGPEGWREEPLQDEDVNDVPPPKPVYPAPITHQYCGADDESAARHTLHVELPSDTVDLMESLAKASIRSFSDTRQLTIAQKYLTGNSNDKWYHVTTDGWAMSFWDPRYWDPEMAALSRLVPIAWYDLRQFKAVEIDWLQGQEYADAPWLITISQSSGRFTFRVRTEAEAAGWIKAINNAIAESILMHQRHVSEARSLAQDTHTHVVQHNGMNQKGVKMHRGEDNMMHYSLDPKRALHLRRLWIKCLHSMIRCQRPEIFGELFDLYDLDGNEYLSVEEMEMMLKELFVVRKQELERVIEEEIGQVYTPERIALDGERELQEFKTLFYDIGGKLKDHYKRMMTLSNFRTRSAFFWSKLDVNFDGNVSRGEFERRAPDVLMPLEELELEAKFYEGCSKALDKVKAEKNMQQMLERVKKGDMPAPQSEEEEGGCTYQ